MTNSALVEMSLRITKASYQTSKRDAMKWSAVDSDTDADLFAERMSKDLYMDFCSRIENKTPVPEPFQEVICESDWCGGMPYLSIAHYKAGEGSINVPGSVDSVYMDGNRLKSKGTLHDNPIGRKVFDALREDLYMEKSNNTDHLPVRISIGFLDLEHEHVAQVAGGQSFTFTRTDVGQICPLCSQGIGGKIYKKGQLVHLAMTRVPVNPRTSMEVEKSMGDEIVTKRDDAKSIIGELADELEEKSIAQDVLVVRSDSNTPDPSPISKCYDPNTGGWDNACIASVFDNFMAEMRNQIGAVVKSKTDVTEKSTEEKMATEEKSVMGIPEKPFNFAGLDGNGNNTVAAPVKAKVDEEAGEKDDSKDEEKKEMSTALDQSYSNLKSVLANAKSVEEVQAAFNALGQEVEKSYTPPAPDATDLAAIVRSAVEAAVAPLKVEIATLKSAQSNTVSTQAGVVKSKALSFNGLANTNDPNALLQRAIPQAEQPMKQLSQIERIARKSTGLQS